VILLGVLVCLVGAACFVASVWKNSERAVGASVVVFLLGFALLLLGFNGRQPHDPHDSCPENSPCMNE
jgi:drug/metabolite transporter (DMT)-like permease